MIGFKINFVLSGSEDLEDKELICAMEAFRMIMKRKKCKEKNINVC